MHMGMRIRLDVASCDGIIRMSLPARSFMQTVSISRALVNADGSSHMILRSDQSTGVWVQQHVKVRERKLCAWWTHMCYHKY